MTNLRVFHQPHRYVDKYSGRVFTKCGLLKFHTACSVLPSKISCERCKALPSFVQLAILLDCMTGPIDEYTVRDYITKNGLLLPLLDRTV